MEKFKWPQDIIDDIKLLYSDQPSMHELALKGNINLIRYLEGSYSVSIHFDSFLTIQTLADIDKYRIWINKEKQKNIYTHIA